MKIFRKIFTSKYLVCYNKIRKGADLMKKLLALLLAMLICFALIACDTPEESSSSSSNEELSSESFDNETVEYYFHKGFFERVDSVPETKIEIVNSIDEYSRLTEGLSFKEEGSYGSLKEGLFETHYLLKITTYSSKRGEILGYRDALVSENGELYLTLDKVFYYNAKTIDSNGNIFYEVITDAENNRESALPNTEEMPIQGSNIIAFYDFVLIPKSSIDTEITDSTKMTLRIVTVPICIH
jgi:hypothetical protein